MSSRSEYLRDEALKTRCYKEGIFQMLNAIYCLLNDREIKDE